MQGGSFCTPIQPQLDHFCMPINMYYIRYRRGGRAGSLIGEPVGKSTEGMTPTKAAIIRAERMTGKALSNKEDRRQKEKEKVLAQSCRMWMLHLKDVSTLCRWTKKHCRLKPREGLPL